jgi:hypothetical protein
MPEDKIPDSEMKSHYGLEQLTDNRYKDLKEIRNLQQT